MFSKFTHFRFNSQTVIFTCKDTIAPQSVDYQLEMLNFKLYIYIKGRLVQNMTNLQYFMITIIGIDYY